MAFDFATGRTLTHTFLEGYLSFPFTFDLAIYFGNIIALYDVGLFVVIGVAKVGPLVVIRLSKSNAFVSYLFIVVFLQPSYYSSCCDKSLPSCSFDS